MNKAQTPPITLFDGHLRSNVGRCSHFEENVGVATEMAAWTDPKTRFAWDKFLVSSAPICQGWWKMFPIYPPLHSPWKFDAWKMIHFLFMANCLFSNCSFQEGIPLFRILPPAGVSALQGCISGVMGPPKKKRKATFLQRQKKAKAESKRKKPLSKMVMFHHCRHSSLMKIILRKSCIWWEVGDSTHQNVPILLRHYEKFGLKA